MLKNAIVKLLLIAVVVCSSFRVAQADNHDTSKALECKPVQAVLAELDAAKAKGYAVLEGDDLARAIYFVRISEVAGMDRQWTVAMVAILADDSLVLAVGINGQLCNGIRIGAEAAPGLLKAIFGVQV